MGGRSISLDVTFGCGVAATLGSLAFDNFEVMGRVSCPVGCWCRFRALPQSGVAWPRFLLPLIEPDVRNYRIRLYSILSDLRPRQVVEPHWNVV
jgi:hypothetical protein